MIAKPTAHDSPFANLPVPFCAESLPPALTQRWVEPVYFGLDGPDVARFVARDLAHVDDALIERLLSDRGWRERTAAGYLVALLGRHAFVPRIGDLLLRSDAPYAGAAFCLALAECGSEEAMAYLHRYLDYYLTRPDLDFDQGHALAALGYLDRTRGGEAAARHRAAWAVFADGKQSRDLDRHQAMFDHAMARLHALRALPRA